MIIGKSLVQSEEAALTFFEYNLGLERIEYCGRKFQAKDCHTEARRQKQTDMDTHV